MKLYLALATLLLSASAARAQDRPQAFTGARIIPISGAPIGRMRAPLRATRSGATP